MFHVKQIPKPGTKVYRKNTLQDQLKEKGNTHFSEISSNSSINLAAKPSRRNSGATERAVTCPCHSSLATEPSALPITADRQSISTAAPLGQRTPGVHRYRGVYEHMLQQLWRKAEQGMSVLSLYDLATLYGYRSNTRASEKGRQGP